MKSYNWKMIAGILLLLLGGLTLLDTFNLIPGLNNIWEWLMAGVFLLGGGAFLLALRNDRQQNWWAAIPGMVLLGLGLTILVSAFPALEDLGGMIFLASIGAAFWLVYGMNHNHWWAIIPGGVLFTLALVSGIEDSFRLDGGAVFFLGLSLTFALLALLPTGNVRWNWPWIPAAVLFALGAVLALSAENMLQFLLPVGLIIAGLYLVARTFMKQK